MILSAVRETGTAVLITVSPEGGEAGGGEEFRLSVGEWKRLNRSFGYDPEAGMVLSPGTPLDEALYDAVAAAAERTAALRYAAEQLSFSDRSAAGLRAKLTAKGFSREAAEHAVAQLEKKGWLDEGAACLRYAEAALRSRSWGRRRILDALLSKGYGRQEAAAAVRALPEEALADALRRQIERKFPDFASLGRPEREKAYAALMRLGFSADEIRRAWKEMTEA